MTHFEFRETAEAVRVWNSIRQTHPSYVIAYCRLAYVATEQGNFEGAESLYRSALDLVPGSPEIRFGLAETLTNLGRLDEALAMLEELPPESDPQAVAMRILRAQICTEQGEYRKAKGECETVIRLAPQTPQAYFGLSVACDRLGQTEAAAKYRQEFEVRKKAGAGARHEAKGTEADLQHARAIAASTLLAVGESYLRRGDLKEGETNWRRAVEIKSMSPAPRERLAQFYMEQGRFEEAEKQLKQLAESHPDCLNAYLMQGKLYSLQGRVQDTEKAFQQVIQLAPNLGAGYAALAHHYFKTHRNLTTACELARKAVELEPTAKHYYVLGLCASEAGRLDEAREAVTQAVTLDPDNPIYRRPFERRPPQ